MIHKWHIWYDFLKPVLSRMVGKKYGCCDKIRNCKRCLKMKRIKPRPIILSVNEAIGVFEGREIVFCKDCVFGRPDKYRRGEYICSHFFEQMRANDYCSKGQYTGEPKTCGSD